MKLDRVLCRVDWESMYPDCILQGQSTKNFDHCPLVLGLKEGFHRKKRFHFESFWNKLANFHETVPTSWDEPAGEACPLERIALKLKRPTRALQSWSQKQVGHIKSQHTLAREIFLRLEIAQDQHALNEDEKWLRNELRKHYLVLASFERTIACL